MHAVRSHNGSRHEDRFPEVRGAHVDTTRIILSGVRHHPAVAGSGSRAAKRAGGRGQLVRRPRAGQHLEEGWKAREPRRSEVDGCAQAQQHSQLQNPGADERCKDEHADLLRVLQAHWHAMRAIRHAHDGRQIAGQENERRLCISSQPAYVNGVCDMRGCKAEEKEDDGNGHMSRVGRMSSSGWHHSLVSIFRPDGLDGKVAHEERHEA